MILSINRFQSLLFILILLFGIVLPIGTNAQSFQNINSIKVEELTDQQIIEMLNRAKSMGYSEQDIFQVAQAEGVSYSEISKLRARVNKIKLLQTNPTEVEENSPEIEKIQELKTSTEKIALPNINYFGYSIFNDESKTLSFETNLKIPTPLDYIIGPSDQIVINVYGASEINFTETVLPNGNILLSNIGPIHVSGLTIDQATKTIRASLAKVYQDLISSNPGTFLQVSIGSIRNIKVNMVGELNIPGTYTVNGLASVFNALYAAGGPTLNGTLRDIRVYRKNKLISTVDVYDFLINGITQNNIRLQNDDIIIVGPYKERVQIIGQVKRPGFYELKQNESFSDLLKYTGGFTDQAYTNRINVTRNTDRDKLVSDILENQFNLFIARGGDVYTIGKIENRFQNRVIIEGAVYRPGSYALSESMTARELVETADGLRGDAFMNRAIIVRSLENYNTATITVDLSKLMAGEIEDIKLEREDVFKIYSIYDLKEETYVRISGEVNAPGVFRYSENMSVENLISMANGFKVSAQEGSVEISRRPEKQSRDYQSEVIKLEVNRDLNLSETDIGVNLNPYDHVIVRRNPNYFEERIVQVLGQVNFPGQYAILSEGERISDIIKRVGGYNELAYLKGATLTRKTEFFNKEKSSSNRRENLIAVLNSIGTNTEADEILRDNISSELNSNYQYQEFENPNLVNQVKRQRLNDLVEKNPFLSDIKIRESETIAIDISKILSNPGLFEDLMLEDGDIINIPKESSTVRLRGRVLYPNTIRYESGKSLGSYVSGAGGFDTRAKKNRTYVVYTNGSVARTKNFLFLKFYPSIEPGSEIIVPVKPLKIPIKPNEIIGMTTGLAALSALIIQILK